MKSFIKYINEQFLCEHFLTLFHENDMKKYAKEVWDIASRAYKYIGGIAGCKSYEDFLEQYVNNCEQDKIMWKCVKREDHIKAIRIYTHKRGGRKSIIMCCDNTPQGKEDLNKIVEEDFKLKDREAWSEQSGKALGYSLKIGRSIVPNTVIVDLMKDKWDKGEIKLLDDGFFYIRKIAGIWHCKAVVGNPPNGEAQPLTDEEIQQYKNLSIEYAKKYEFEDCEDSKDKE